MKKVLILFLAIVVVGAGLGFGATSTLNNGDPGNITNDLGQNDGVPSTNTAQNSGSNLDDNTGQSDGNNQGTDIKNGQDNWYNGFWGDGNSNNDGFWKDENKDHGKDKDKKKDNEDNKDQINIEINNYISTAATGGNAQTTGGNSESTVETKSASSNVPQQIESEIAEANDETGFTEEIPMQKTGLPVVPALLSTLLISSGLLYRKLRK